MEGFCLSETKRDRPVLFSEIVDDYVQFQNAHNRPPHNDCVRILFWKDRWRDCPVAAISRQDVEQGKLALSERRDPQRTPKRHPNKRTYRPAIINRYLAALQGCLNLAIRNGKATTNPSLGRGSCGKTMAASSTSFPQRPSWPFSTPYRTHGAARRWSSPCTPGSGGPNRWGFAGGTAISWLGR
jgi:hypothetical protein